MKIIATVLIILISFFIYSSTHSRFSYTPHTWYGYLFGIIASLFIIFSLAYSLRKRYLKMSWRALNFWYSWHIYLGWIALFFIFYHCDFKVRGMIPTILFYLFVAVILSGYLFIIVWKIQNLRWKYKDRIDPEEFNRKILNLLSYVHIFLFIAFFLFLLLHIGFSLPRSSSL